MAFPAFFAMLIASFGWRHSYFALAGIISGLITFVNLYMVDYPKDMGLLPDGEEIIQAPIEMETVSSLEIEA